MPPDAGRSRSAAAGGLRSSTEVLVEIRSVAVAESLMLSSDFLAYRRRRPVSDLVLHLSGDAPVSRRADGAGRSAHDVLTQEVPPRGGEQDERVGQGPQGAPGHLVPDERRPEQVRPRV